MTDIEKTIDLVRNAIKDLPERYKMNFDEIGKLDKETQDLLHLAEFKDLDIQRGFRLYKEIQKVRKRRRKLKNENELIAPALDTLENYQRQVQFLDKAIGTIRNKKKMQKNRHYTTKVRNDLGETIK